MLVRSCSTHLNSPWPSLPSNLAVMMKLTTLIVSFFTNIATSKPLSSLPHESIDVDVQVHVGGALVSPRYVLLLVPPACPMQSSFQRSINIPSLRIQKETTRTFIRAYNAWDMEAILAYRTMDCQHHILPSSMGRPAQSNNDYREYLKGMMPLFSNFTVFFSFLQIRQVD
jgi:hypothetical protein